MLRSRRRSTSALWALCFACSLHAVGCASKVTAPPEPPVAVRLGDAAFEAEDYERAIRDYRLYLGDVDRGEYTARAFYKAALASYRLEDYAGTLATLDELALRYPGADWVQVDALRGDALRELGRPQDAVLAWDAAWSEANEIERPKIRARVAGVVAGLDAATLRELRGDVRSRGVRSLIASEIASRTPPAIDEPVPALAAAPPVVAEPEAEAPAVDAAQAAPAPAAEPDVAAAPEPEVPAAEAAVVEAEPAAEQVVIADEPVAVAEPAAEADGNVARLVKTERPLDPESAVVEEAPAAEAAPAADTSGVARLQRIDYPGAAATEATVESLEKLDVPAAAGATP